MGCKRRTTFLAVYIGLSAVVFSSPIGSVEETPASSADQSQKKTPDLVAELLRSGNLNCPNSDSLGYESCLIYQGAMGTWQAVGLPNACPSVDETFDQFPWRPAGKLKPEDALRAPSVPCFAHLYAIQVAVTVPILISTATRAFRMLNGVFAEPGSNPRLCLEARHGLCGNQAAVAIALFERAGFQARPVKFFYESKGVRRSHVIAEVLIDRAWRVVDPTYGAYWINKSAGTPFGLRTLDEILDPTDKNTKRVSDPAILPHVLHSMISRRDYFNYLSSDADILRGEVGQIRLSLSGNKGTELFKDLPNYVGDNVLDGNSQGVEYKFGESLGTFKLTVSVAATATDGSDGMYLCVDSLCHRLSRDAQRYEFTAVQPKTLYLKSKNDVAYVVLKSLEWDRH